MLSSNHQVHKKPAIQIYYDGECGFCKRSVELIVRYFFVQTSHIASAQSIEGVYKIMQEKDSWVVINQRGEVFTTFAAGVEIARHSPILKWLVPLAKFGFIKKFGEWVYRKVAKNRHKIWLP